VGNPKIGDRILFVAVEPGGDEVAKVLLLLEDGPVPLEAGKVDAIGGFVNLQIPKFDVGPGRLHPLARLEERVLFRVFALEGRQKLVFELPCNLGVITGALNKVAEAVARRWLTRNHLLISSPAALPRTARIGSALSTYTGSVRFIPAKLRQPRIFARLACRSRGIRARHGPGRRATTETGCCDRREGVRPAIGSRP